MGEAEVTLAAGIGDAQRRRPSHPGRCVTLSWPLDNLGPSLPETCSRAVAGNLFELKQLLRAAPPLDIDCPTPSRRLSRAGSSVSMGTGPARRRARKSADRHDHQASVGLGTRRDGRARSGASPMPASTSSRTTSCRPTPGLSVDLRVRAVMRVVNEMPSVPARR